jgi:two-component system heavy metal sensor histidine kinase CusS
MAVAHQGVRSLRELVGVLSGVTVKNLGDRIAADRWPLELRELAVAANNMFARLEESFERLYKSANNLSHKVRTPLTILRGEAEVALSRDRSVEELRDVIASSLEENARLQRLIDNILFLSNADIGKCEAVLSKLDAREELDKVVDFYQPCAEDKGINLTCQGAGVVVADAALFRKTAAALISNALTYSEAGASVELVLRQTPGEGVELTVSDSGCGIPEPELGKIFDRFYRVYATRYMDPHGTGLGLPIVKVVMELHNGGITVHSAPGRGTVVTVSFPPAA